MKINLAKPIKVGNSFYFTIPKQFINNGMVELDKRYNIEFDVDFDSLSDLSPKKIERITQKRVMRMTAGSSKQRA